MPRLSEATKDVTSCDKPRTGANTRLCADFRMGQPDACRRIILLSRRRTRGTETSHYPEEKKTKVIAPVVASERARAQTGTVEAGPGLKDRRQSDNGRLGETSGKACRSR